MKLYEKQLALVRVLGKQSQWFCVKKMVRQGRSCPFPVGLPAKQSSVDRREGKLDGFKGGYMSAVE